MIHLIRFTIIEYLLLPPRSAPVAASPRLAPKKKETVVLAVPEEYIDKIITLYHSSLFAVHQGVIKT